MNSLEVERRRAPWFGLTAAALVLVLTVSACGASADLAAEVSGAEQSAQYTASEFNDYLATTDPENEARASRKAAAAWLSDWVFFSAIEMELASRGVQVTNEAESLAVADLTLSDPEFVPGAAGGDVAIRQRAIGLTAAQWAEQQVPAVLASTVAAGWRHLCSRHILVDTPQLADQILALLATGVDFASFAAQISLDTNSGSRGGELGCVPEGSLVAPFEEAAYSAEPGVPVLAETQFGFHVIEVISSGPATSENHPQLDDDALAQMVLNVTSLAEREAQTVVQNERRQLLLDLQEAVLTDYASRVKINERYGYWDPEMFVVAVAPLG